MRRRRLITGLGAAGAASIAGCLESVLDRGPTTRTEAGPDADFYVAPDGSDDAEGTSRDRPFATVDRAREAVRQRRSGDGDPGSTTVLLRGGRYRIEEPLEFTAADGGSADAPVTYAAYPDERPVIDGSREIEGWEQATIDGVDVWKATVPAVADGEWYFRQLFVDGERRPRPRLPKAADEVLEGRERVADEDEQFYRFQGGASGPAARTFTPESGSIDPDWRNLSDVDVVSMTQWISGRAPVESVDPATGDVTVALRPYPGDFVGWNDRLYYVENVFEALEEPGEWYLDRETGECYYVPREGEAIDDVTISAPRTRRLLTVAGTSDDPVEHLRFEGLTFTHASWDYFVKPDWNTSQSAFPTVGAVRFRYADACSLVGCVVRGVGEYAVAVVEGCERLELVGNEFADAGAGGVKMASNAAKPEVTGAGTGENRIVDNHVHGLGNVFEMGAGVLATDTYGNEISHNHIHDGYYTGVSVGWSWGFQDSAAGDNLIGFNHIHDLGKGLLSDMGGIYTLGVQPGTTVRNNYIHDVYENEYGGWGLYPDEGSTGIRWEDNVVHDTLNGLHLHYGGGNLIRNNVIVRSRERPVAFSQARSDSTGPYEYGMALHHNVLVADGVPIYDAVNEDLRSDYNLFWDAEREEVIITEATLVGLEEGVTDTKLSLERWQEEFGMDEHSIVADPEFEDPSADDYGLREGSSAFDAPVEFEAIDLSAVGPRERTPLRAPPAVTARLRDDGTVELDWRTVEAASGYRLFRATATGPFDLLADDLAETEYVDGDAETITGRYHYAVAAVGAESTSGLSPSATVDPNPPPTGVVASSVDAETVELAWDPTPTAEKYRVLRATEADGPYEGIVETDGTSVIDRGPSEDVHYYAVTALADGTESRRSDPTFAQLSGDARLRLHWPLDGADGEGATDASGNGKHGTISGGAEWTDGALELSPDATVMTTDVGLSTSALSVAWRLYPRSRENYNQNLGAASGWGTFTFHTEKDGGAYVGIDHPTDRFTPADVPPGTVELDTWQHFAFVWGGSEGRAAFYKNGERIADATEMADGRTVTLRDFVLNSIDGRIRDVRLYNGTLPGYAVRNLFQEG